MNNFDTVLYKVVALNRSYSTNTQAIYNDDIPQEPENLRFAPFIFFFCIFNRYN